MKTQLLEDIGHSTSSLAPSDKVSSSLKKKGMSAGHAGPFALRPTSGVWRKKPPAEEALPAAPHPPQQASLTEATKASTGPAEDANAPHSPPHEAVATAARPALDAHASPASPAQADPLFDFAPRSPAPAALEASNTAAGWFQRSGQRYLMWGGCALLAALVVQGGWWLYGARKDAGSLALVANEFKAEPQQERPSRRRPLTVKEFTLGPDGEVRVAPAAPVSSAAPLVRASPAVPPLAVLPPEQGADAIGETAPPAPPVADGGAQQRRDAVSGRDTEKKAGPLAKRVRQSEREQPARRTTPAPALAERLSGRRVASATALRSGGTSAHQSTMAETLKACRAHGYHAAQCVKRACSVTKYGFVCRGK